jgi:hypothetical protein
MRERSAEGVEFADEGLLASIGIFTFFENINIQSELGLS